MEGHLEAMNAFGLACLDDLVGQEVHEDVEQEGGEVWGEGAALPHAHASEPLTLFIVPCHPHLVTIV